MDVNTTAVFVRKHGFNVPVRHTRARMKHLEDAIVLSNREIRPGIWSLWLRSPRICSEVQPGQFVHVRVSSGFHPLLRRPLSVGRVDGDRLELVWRVVGTGTQLMTQSRPYDTLNLLGPLGTPFTFDLEAAQRILVAGGLGLPPLVFLYDRFRQRNLPAKLYLGVKGGDDIPLAGDDDLLNEMDLTAELGEGFRRGLVTASVAEDLSSAANTRGIALYACGPWGMVHALRRAVEHIPLRLAEVSLEQQMGCASGVCQGCAVKVDGGETPYRLVCRDGPVFPLDKVHPPQLV